MTGARERVLNAVWRLNAEAYEKQRLTVGKPLKQFVPCAKAEQLMQVLRKGEHVGTAHIMANRAICACHVGLTDDQLMSYEFDCTYRIAANAQDYKTLYPNLYK